MGVQLRLACLRYSLVDKVALLAKEIALLRASLKDATASVLTSFTAHPNTFLCRQYFQNDGTAEISGTSSLEIGAPDVAIEGTFVRIN